MLDQPLSFAIRIGFSIARERFWRKQTIAIGINAEFARATLTLLLVEANEPREPRDRVDFLSETRTDIIRGYPSHIEKSSFVGAWYGKCERIRAEQVGAYVIRAYTYAATVYFRLR
jgi:hypothetical protein